MTLASPAAAAAARRLLAELSADDPWGGADPGACAGVDEVGRGCLFGPVLAGAVVLPAEALTPLAAAGLTDSKKLSPRRRAALVPLIRAWARHWALGQASAAEIDRLGIRPATERAMLRALQRLPTTPELLLVDGILPLRGWSGPQRTLVRGDSRCLAIAAAWPSVTRVTDSNAMPATARPFTARHCSIWGRPRCTDAAFCADWSCPRGRGRWRGLLTPVFKVGQQLLTHPVLDAQQDAGQQRVAGGFEHPRRDQLEQRRLADPHGQGRFTAEAIAAGHQPGLQAQFKVVDQTQPLQVAVQGLQLQAIAVVVGAQLDDRLDAQLKHLQRGDGVAVAAGPQGVQLLGIEQGVHHPLLVAEVLSQAITPLPHAQLQLLAGAEGQGHELGPGAA